MVTTPPARPENKTKRNKIFLGVWCCCLEERKSTCYSPSSWHASLLFCISFWVWGLFVVVVLLLRFWALDELRSGEKKQKKKHLSLIFSVHFSNTPRREANYGRERRENRQNRSNSNNNNNRVLLADFPLFFAIDIFALFLRFPGSQPRLFGEKEVGRRCVCVLLSLLLRYSGVKGSPMGLKGGDTPSSLHFYWLAFFVHSGGGRGNSFSGNRS